MLVTELFSLFRNDVVDVVEPNLWTDDEVYSYMDDAYKMFVRLTGGIPDSSSDITQVGISAGEEYSPVSPLILKFREAELASDGSIITIINNEDLARLTRSDYGVQRSFRRNSPGRVTHMVVGRERNAREGTVRWVGIPQTDDTALLSVYRLPRNTIREGVAESALDEIGEEHHVNLLMWMRYRAYSKDDSETLDRNQARNNMAAFNEYCEFVKAENERYKSKPRVVSYGGL